MYNKFTILNNGVLETYMHFDDIPKKFDNLVDFNPHMIPPPHTEEEHIINAQWQGKFKELMKRETK